MQHRHLDYPLETPVADLPSAAIVDILDRGHLDDWLPLLAAVALNPAGPLAERIAGLVDAYPMYGTSPLWRAWIERCRVRAEPRATHTLGELRRLLGMTQATVAVRLGISQSDVSKLERRNDLRVSTLRDYIAALGHRLHLVAGVGAGPTELELSLVMPEDDLGELPPPPRNPEIIRKRSRQPLSR